MFVKDCMSANPIFISPATPILEALNIMKKNKIRQLPVVENNKLAGLVTERELLTVTPSPATTLSIRVELPSVQDGCERSYGEKACCS